MSFRPLYFFSQALKNIWRNKGTSIASVLILIACLLVTGTFYTVNKNITYNLDGVGGLNKILVYINENCRDDQIRAIKGQAEKLSNAKRVVLVSKEEALEDEKNRLGSDADVFKWLDEGENPYRASLEIEYYETEKVAELQEQLSAIEGVDTVVSRTDMALRVADVKSAVSRIFLGLMILLFVVSLFVIITTIRLALSGRSKEITVMRYVGATGGFIAIPFLLEGLLLGLVAALCAFGLQQYVYSLLSAGAAKELFGLISFLPASSFRGVLFPLFLAVGVGTGLIGSTVSFLRYVKA